MEDGLNDTLSDVVVSSDHTKNGVVPPIMANFPEGTVAVTKDDNQTSSPAASDQQPKVNGDNNEFNDECSSESDALVIDESIPARKPAAKKKQTKSKGKKSDNSDVLTHSNPYFNESIFDLSEAHQVQVATPPPPPNNCNHKQKRGGKTKAKPKLREYAQYLGLQPTVQFKCSKCGLAGFESLTTLQAHVVQCDAVENIIPTQTTDTSYSGFKLTRKVFLCSACGTYYENWNLYMHMLEFHRRYICLYCLGMFSVLDDLCQHIQSRHNLEPGYKNTLDEFFSAYNEPCYITCCECNKLFSEQDNFFDHICVNSVNNKTSKSKQIKQQIRPENHVTGESTAPIKEPEADVDLDEENQPQVDKIQLSPVAEATNDIPLTVPAESSLESIEESITEPLVTPEATLNVLAEEPTTENCAVDENPHEKMNGDHVDADFMEMDTNSMSPPPPVVETRKVPKLSLKLTKPGSYQQIEPEDPEEDSDDSEKLTMEVEQIEEEDEDEEDEEEEEEIPIGDETPAMAVAGLDVTIIELELEQPLDKFDVRQLLQKCLRATAPTCIYCNHARKIAVNGKQLGLHAIAEHRFAGIVNSITAEELIPESFNNRFKESLEELAEVFFNLETIASNEAITFSHVFECFPCRFTTAIHKELYLHNRKLHAKNMLLCIMCKSNFYSYSELICHLCPGLYVLDYDLKFRCCMCINDDLPSAFRLLVHLRKRHNVCDVCLEVCHDQYLLSNHVWKHKLHHFCYRCCIAYRNKPDIKRHLFWKHGTESVLCKKCLQKKWPHVYHFCVPAARFTCEECSLTFSKAVSLRVHKRIHTDDKKHQCSIEGCEEKFISKKLRNKHELKHFEPEPEPEMEKPPPPEEPVADCQEEIQVEDVKPEEEEPKPKPKIDVYDLPELNLSESDSSDSEPEVNSKQEENLKQPNDCVLEESTVSEENCVDLNLIPSQDEPPTPVIENIWDNFKNYQANKEKLDNMFVETEIEEPEAPQELTVELALRDHDYFLDPERKQQDTSLIEVKPDLTMTERVDHDYCSPKIEPKASPKKTASSSSDSSSDSSSSCSCGSNCSCTSSSGSSSSSSDSSDSDSSTEEGRKRQQARRLKRKERNKKKKNVEEVKAEVKPVVTQQPVEQKVLIDAPICESDLETTESETDEEFYDKQPQKLAKKIIEEKRNQLLAEIEPHLANGASFIESTSRPPTPMSLTHEETPKSRKKSKSKKRKKKKSERRELGREYTEGVMYQQHHHRRHYKQTVAPITLSLKNSPVTTPRVDSPSLVYEINNTDSTMFHGQDSNDSSLRASKRRRVRNKFYGYSSDEEQEKNAAMAAGAPGKWRKVETPFRPQSPKVVPRITIKTGPLVLPPQPTVEPLSIRTTSNPGEMRVHRKTAPPVRPHLPPRPPPPQLPPTPIFPSIPPDKDSGSDSNDSSAEEPSMIPPPKPQQQLYCYCQCPYDEVSEMIGCDSSECEIEWFHFECVGIMVPPKGQWFCPDCRKKNQQRRELS